MSYESMIVRGPYGNEESNPITDEVRATREAIDHKNPVHLTDARLARITRLRLVTSPGFPMYDVSYCYGELRDGTPVLVRLPRYQFSRRNLNAQLIEMCRESNVYAKGLGLLNADTISVSR